MPPINPLSMPLVRQLSPEDTDGYGAMWADAVENHPTFFRSTLSDDPSGRIPTRFRVDSFTLGAFDGEALIGILSLDRDTRIKLCHKAFISRMFVKPGCAGKGVGRLLLREAVRQAGDVVELRQLYLTVLDTNNLAKSLYLSEGFEKFSHEPQAVFIEGHYVDECQMMLILGGGD
ncbi:MAG: GNAT superfamily N-acetyltransferase [Halieaceae bacterium]